MELLRGCNVLPSNSAWRPVGRTCVTARRLSLGECLPEALLLDLGMPVLDGYRTVQKIRENPRWATLPVLAVTAYAMQGDKERILSCGFDGYLSNRSIRRFFSKNSNVCYRPVAEKSLRKTENARRVDRYELRHQSRIHVAGRVHLARFAFLGASSGSRLEFECLCFLLRSAAMRDDCRLATTSESFTVHHAGLRGHVASGLGAP
jgi:CheY-like chemotaxis protein